MRSVKNISCVFPTYYRPILHAVRRFNHYQLTLPSFASSASCVSPVPSVSLPSSFCRTAASPAIPRYSTPPSPSRPTPPWPWPRCPCPRSGWTRSPWSSSRAPPSRTARTTPSASPRWCPAWDCERTGPSPSTWSARRAPPAGRPSRRWCRSPTPWCDPFRAAASRGTPPCVIRTRGSKSRGSSSCHPDCCRWSPRRAPLDNRREGVSGGELGRPTAVLRVVETGRWVGDVSGGGDVAVAMALTRPADGQQDRCTRVHRDYTPNMRGHLRRRRSEDVRACCTHVHQFEFRVQSGLF